MRTAFDVRFDPAPILIAAVHPPTCMHLVAHGCSHKRGNAIGGALVDSNLAASIGSVEVVLYWDSCMLLLRSTHL